MSGDDALSDVQYLTGSPQRPAVLRALRRAPRRPTALTEEIDATRTTVQRILAGFLDRGWVRKRDGEYAVTPIGRRVLAAYEELADAVVLGQRLAPVADLLDDLDPAPPEGALEGVEVTTAAAGAPMAPLDRFVEWYGAREDEHVRAAAPVVSRSLVAALRDVASESVRTSVVLAGASLDGADGEDGTTAGFDRTADGASGGADGASGGPDDVVGTADGASGGADDVAGTADGTDARPSLEVDLAVYPGTIPAGVAVGETSVCVVLHDADGAMAATLVGDDPALHEWASSRYEAYASAARPVGECENGGTDRKERVQR